MGGRRQGWGVITTWGSCPPVAPDSPQACAAALPGASATRAGPCCAALKPPWVRPWDAGGTSKGSLIDDVGPWKDPVILAEVEAGEQRW